MTLPRRFLPPLPWLSAFEAVARLGSVTQAATELDLTQGAVSRQVQKLEDRLGQRLFTRDRQRLTLTPAGAAYAKELRGALATIASATLSLASNPHGGLLNLAILPAFGTYWLAPRLPGFMAAHPGVTVNLATRTHPFDFAREEFHAAIHFGQRDWPGAGFLKLMEEENVAVASPSLLATRRVALPADVAALPRLQIESRKGAWRRWFMAHGLGTEDRVAVQFDQFATMIEAAKQGLGAALVPRFLIGAELASGALVALPQSEAGRFGSYYLVWPDAGADYPPLVALRDWLAGEVGGGRHPAGGAEKSLNGF